MDTFNSQLRLRLYSIDNIRVYVILPLFLWTVGKAQSAITCYNEATTTNKQIEKQKGTVIERHTQGHKEASHRKQENRSKRWRMLTNWPNIINLLQAFSINMLSDYAGLAIASLHGALQCISSHFIASMQAARKNKTNSESKSMMRTAHEKHFITQKKHTLSHTQRTDDQTN